MMLGLSLSNGQATVSIRARALYLKEEIKHIPVHICSAIEMQMLFYSGHMLTTSSTGPMRLKQG